MIEMPERENLIAPRITEDRKVIWILAGFFALNLALRIPAFFHELAPLSFCDEDLMVDYAYRMLRSSTLKVGHYLSGGINFYLPMTVAKIVELISWRELSAPEFRILARIVSSGVLSSATIFWIYAILRALGGSLSTIYVTLLIYTFSPMILGVSRYHYPDHYMVFFVAAVILGGVKILQSRSRDQQVRRIYMWTGVAVGLMCSVKYSGILLYAWIAFASLLAMLLEMSEKDEKRSPVFFSYLRLGLLTTFMAFISFSFTNPKIFEHWNDFKEGLMVKHYGPATSLLPGMTFYSEVLFLTFFGVLGVFAFLIGVKDLLKRDKILTLLLLLMPLGLPIFFSRYATLYNRNMILASPFVIIVSGIGLAAIFRAVGRKRPFAMGLVAVAFFIEPLYRSFYSYQRDFRIDSRLQAKEWIKENFEDGNRTANVNIDSNSGCGYKKLITVKNNPTQDCLNYVILDNWFGGVDTAGRLKNGRSLKYMLSEPDYKSYHFMADLMNEVNVGLGPEFSIIQEFDGSGPKVYVYKNTACESVAGLSTGRSIDRNSL